MGEESELREDAFGVSKGLPANASKCTLETCFRFYFWAKFVRKKCVCVLLPRRMTSSVAAVNIDTIRERRS